MKNFLRHLNQALYDTNQAIWHEWLRPLLVYITFGLFLIAFSLIPVFFVDNETFFYAWPVFGIIFSSFCLITYLIYYKSRHKEPAEPEVIFQSEVDDFSIIKEPVETEPLTIKQSIHQGLWWTGYIFLIVLIAILVVSVWDFLY